MKSLGFKIDHPARVRTKLSVLEGKRDLTEANRSLKVELLGKLNAYLGIATEVDSALDKLSDQLFGRIVKVLEENLTLALQEVLDQPIVLKVTRDYQRGGATISFHIERNGQHEDIMKGQGGSVANILSVGLRMFALTTRDPAVHRRFLVLDEQDCWLRPDLVPRLAKIVHNASRDLGFQVLMISHHDVSLFRKYADRIYQVVPSANGVIVKESNPAPSSLDD